ncbi:acetyl xylan esterase [Opitutaceae bacterium TAV5]|nr:acetyl xylan esterase [Opitutaceae bacterium TAV5]
MLRSALLLLISVFPIASLPAMLDSAATIVLPDPLLTGNGVRITSATQWEELRRPELLELFREHVYGRNPAGRPDALRFEVTSTADAFDGLATCRQVRITCVGPHGELSFPLTVYLPKTPARPRGCFLLIVNRNRKIITESENNPQGFWPAREIIARGYATAAFHNSDLAPDDKTDGFRSGVFSIHDAPRTGGEPRPGNAWGTIAAWSWGASRAIDWIVTEPALHGVPVAVAGHSRGGKAALWCGAQDRRVALAISNNSGSTGAAPARITRGETVKDINGQFPHWFARNYHDYGADVSRLPVDQHELLALLAPRLVYVASASEDAWADPAAEFRACVEAGPVYGLYTLPGVGAVIQPGIAQPLHTGAIGYHLRAGKHDLTAEDWGYFMDFTDLRWRDGEI